MPVNMCLIPVVAGVGIASASDLSFTWDCFAFAMGSNLCFSLRGILSKKAMNPPQGENMDASNLFAVLQIMAFLAAVPVALIIEGPKIVEAWDAGVAAGPLDAQTLAQMVLMAG